MKTQKKIIKFLYALLLASTAQVPAARADFEFFRGVRQMGMGGASIAVVNDETALLSNPNGLGRLRDKIFTLFDPEVSGSSRGYRTMAGTALLGALDPETLYENLNRQVDRPFYFKSQFFPSLVMPNFGVGLLGRHEVVGTRLADGTFDYRYQNDYSLNVGYNLSFWGGRIKWGVVGRLINRVESIGIVDPATETLNLSSLGREGQAVAMDTGLTLTAPWALLPTLTVLVRDVGGTAFTFNSGMFGYTRNGLPQSIGQSIDVAMALFPIISKDARATFTVEYTGIDQSSSGVSADQRLRVGAEVNYWDAYFFRAGYYNKTWTAGFEYANSLIQWQLATYAEPVPIMNGVYSDRRGVLKFAVRF